MALPPNIWAGLFNQAVRLGYPVDDYDELDQEIAARAATAAAQIAVRFGGRIRNLATGGAPTPPRHMVFARLVARAAEASLVNSYGCTECGAVTADGRQLGPKFAEVKLRLIDHPKLGFTATDKPYPRGEVAVASPSLTLGYIGDPEREVAAFVEVTDACPCPPSIKPPLPKGRWYLTGDLGQYDGGSSNTGSLRLIDRCSAVVSTKRGQIVRQGEIEARLEALHGVRHSVAHASPDWDGVAVILSVDPAWLVPEAEPTASAAVDPLQPMDLGEIIENPSVQVNLTEMDDFGCGVTAWRVGVTTLQWTAENGLLSGEQKKRRGVLLQAYAEALDGLHSRGDRAAMHGLTNDTI